MAAQGALLRECDHARCSDRTPDKVFERVEVEGIDLYTPVVRLPDSLHLELDRRGRVRAFWNGLAWIV
jgi:hypothetical protein